MVALFFLFIIFLGLFREGSPWKPEAQQRSCHLRPSHPAEECNRPVNDNNHSLVSLNVDFNQVGGYYFPINHLSF